MNAKIKEIKEKYLPGMRVRMTKDMNDPYNQGKKTGDEGTISVVDDIGSIHVKWDNGGSLAIIPEVDGFEIIS